MNVRLVLETADAREAFLDLCERSLASDEAVVCLRDVLAPGVARVTLPCSPEACVLATEPRVVRADGAIELVSWVQVPLGDLASVAWEVDERGIRLVENVQLMPTRIGSVRETYASVAP